MLWYSLAVLIPITLSLVFYHYDKKLETQWSEGKVSLEKRNNEEIPLHINICFAIIIFIVLLGIASLLNFNDRHETSNVSQESKIEIVEQYNLRMFDDNFNLTPEGCVSGRDNILYFAIEGEMHNTRYYEVFLETERGFEYKRISFNTPNFYVEFQNIDKQPTLTHYRETVIRTYIYCKNEEPSKWLSTIRHGNETIIRTSESESFVVLRLPENGILRNNQLIKD